MDVFKFIGTRFRAHSAHNLAPCRERDIRNIFGVHVYTTKSADAVYKGADLPQSRAGKAANPNPNPNPHLTLTPHSQHQALRVVSPQQQRNDQKGWRDCQFRLFKTKYFCNQEFSGTEISIQSVLTFGSVARWFSGLNLPVCVCSIRAIISALPVSCNFPP